MSNDKNKPETKSEEKPATPKAELSLNETISQAITAGMVAVTQLQRGGLDPNTPLVQKNKPQINYAMECADCFQPAKACKGKHVKMVVWPSRYQRGFRGIGINGVWYLSTYPGHLVTVPAEAADDILVKINKYVKSEEVMRESRTWDPSKNNYGLTPTSVSK